jgi:hypothetical protein
VYTEAVSAFMLRAAVVAYESRLMLSSETGLSWGSVRGTSERGSKAVIRGWKLNPMKLTADCEALVATRALVAFRSLWFALRARAASVSALVASEAW